MWASFVLQYYKKFTQIPTVINHLIFEIAMFLTLAHKLVNICTAPGISFHRASYT